MLDAITTSSQYLAGTQWKNLPRGMQSAIGHFTSPKPTQGSRTTTQAKGQQGQRVGWKLLKCARRQHGRDVGAWQRCIWEVGNARSCKSERAPTWMSPRACGQMWVVTSEVSTLRRRCVKVPGLRQTSLPTSDISNATSG